MGVMDMGTGMRGK
jgi:hypothetical protein